MRKSKVGVVLLVIVMVVTLMSSMAIGQLRNPRDIAAEYNIPQVDATELEFMLEMDEDIVLIDVRRELEEYNVAHIEGAETVDGGMLEFWIEDVVDDPDAEIIVYCLTAGRSAIAAGRLQEMGYNNVSELEGGFEAWVEAGLPVVNTYGEFEPVN
ncbi:rhodanese-like domain-containing protein [Fuchsiella alkaliacetigena]|uniref:rhodanese-like domain-containing protein n=1 Tax=Fuchsiella alkaliacetigena TaxID=957042 RepID=UPI00200A0EDA|nr:rhodanese-like domain-containing protein [Fuchsiella alkaliacetigena]MCK8825473.1 hypothetical protein [Fuchsiella alkaliacetigena]